jgi:NTP pyrophosphatase (non-canonical NTP hydrolase)
MEFREGLELLCEMCQSRKECGDCLLYVNDCDEGDDMCGLLCNGFDIDLICKTAEQAKKQEEKSMSVEEAVEYVKSHLDARTKLEQLAEEAAELSQAALKLIRAKGLSNNVTPIDEKEALANVREEIIDVLACIKVYDYELDGVDVVEAMENSPKWLRWAERLKGECK